MQGDRPLPIEDVLANTAFVRTMARAVLGQDDRVEDVVQDTWLVAMEKGPRRPGALRAWLAVVARHLALRVLRGAARRDSRQRRGARPEAVPSVAEIVEREEARRRLVVAFLALEDPYRSALLLRYYEDLPVAEVALRLGVPFATARTHIRRGLDRMRARLGRHHDEDRRKWAPALLAWARPPATPEFLAALAMKKFALAAVVLLLAGVGGYLLRPDSSESPSAPGAGAPTPIAFSGTAMGAETSPPPAAGLMARRDGAPSPGARATTGLPFAAGVVVDEKGIPISGALVVPRAKRLVNLGGPDTFEDTALEQGDALASPLASSGADGRFTVEEPVEGLLTLAFLKDGFAAAQSEGLAGEREKHQDLRIVLLPGKRLDGFVRDTEGRPVVGARVVDFTNHVAPDTAPQQRALTDAQGRYSLRFLPAGLQSFFVTAAGYKEIIREASEVWSHPEFVVTRVALLVDVADAEDGSPLPDAGGILLRAAKGTFVAGLGPSHYWPARAPSGQLLLDMGLVVAVEKEGRLDGDLYVLAPGHAPQHEAISLVKGMEPPHIRAALARGAGTPSISGLVLGPTQATVEVRATTPEGFAGEPDERCPVLLHSAVGPDGKFAFGGLPPGPYRVVASAPGFGRAASSVVAPVAELRFELRPSGSVEVAGKTPRGDPARNEWFTVVPLEGNKTYTIQADGGGVARFEELPAGEFRVLPQRAHFSVSWTFWAPWSQIRTLDPGGRLHLDLIVPTRIPVTFSVSDDEGRPRPGVKISLSGTGFAPASAERESDRVAAQRLVTSDAGTVAVDLFPGQYPGCRFVDGTTVRKPAISIPMVAEYTYSLVVPAQTSGIHGRVTERGSGIPIPGRPVRVMESRAQDAAELGSAVTGEDGAFEVGGLPAGTLWLTIAANARPDGRRDVSEAERSPFPYASVDVLVERGGRAEVALALPRVRGAGAIEPTVDLIATVVDSSTHNPLEGAQGWALGLVNGAWLYAGSFEADSEGRAAGKLLAADRYRLYVGRWTLKTPTYATREFELVASKGRITLEAALSPNPLPGR